MNDDEIGSGIATTAASPAPSRHTESIRTGGRDDVPRLPRVPLGAELPLFCERCGYSLNALPQIRCEHCTLLQFHCPECGHHQPINTLRPAMQRTLGKLRALLLGLLVFFKLNWFGWHAFFWVVMGHEWAYVYDRNSGGSSPLQPTLESVMAFAIFAFIFGFISRLLLLRWRRAGKVGAVLGTIICIALLCGFNWRVSDSSRYGVVDTHGVLTAGRVAMTLFTFLMVCASTAAAWSIWSAFVRVAMPERAGQALLEWQRSLSEPAPTARLSDQP